MHLYNVPCDIDASSPFNPLNIIRSTYKAGDFVVVKLDIDNEDIEQVTLPFQSYLLETGIQTCFAGYRV